jgi:hypothetical protein
MKKYREYQWEFSGTVGSYLVKAGFVSFGKKALEKAIISDLSANETSYPNIIHDMTKHYKKITIDNNSWIIV